MRRIWRKKGDCGHHLQYWKEEKGLWSYINCTYVTYNENEKEYPAYCLNRDAHGVERLIIIVWI